MLCGSNSYETCMLCLCNIYVHSIVYYVDNNNITKKIYYRNFVGHFNYIHILFNLCIGIIIGYKFIFLS